MCETGDNLWSDLYRENCECDEKGGNSRTSTSRCCATSVSPSIIGALPQTGRTPRALVWLLTLPPNGPPDRASLRDPGTSTLAPAWPGYHQDRSGMARCYLHNSVLTSRHEPGQPTVPGPDPQFANTSVQTRSLLCWLDRNPSKPIRFYSMSKTTRRARTQMVQRGEGGEGDSRIA